MWTGATQSQKVYQMIETIYHVRIFNNINDKCIARGTRREKHWHILDVDNPHYFKKKRLRGKSSLILESAIRVISFEEPISLGNCFNRTIL